jgi:hypothetical protein
MDNQYYYAKSTGGFYASDINGDHIPSDAVEITADEHSTLLAGQSAGKLMTADKSGHPVLTDPPPSTPEMLAAQMRARRDALIANTDWLVMRHRDVIDAGGKTSLNSNQLKALLAYRQALRDVPQQAGFPDDIQWPNPPNNG